MKTNSRIESNYQFRQRLAQVHVPDRRDRHASPAAGEGMIETGWRIVISESAAPLIVNAARDLQDYLFTSMRVSTLVVRSRQLAQDGRDQRNVIILGTKTDLPAAGRRVTRPRSYRLLSAPGRVIICGHDDRGVSQGAFYLEDLMNLREAPILRAMDVVREPLFSPRMVHSGWGIDQFPDSHLNAMAHHGFDAILVFTRGVDHTTQGYLDFNDLVERAAGFGMDVYLYSYLRSTKHPSDPDAKAYYDSTYGALFKACPRAKGVVLVGESVEFPSRDPKTTGQPYDAPPADGLPPTKPSPGWWPCRDYPQWVGLVKRAIRKYSPQADIVFWTYNWGWAPESARLALLRALPTDITLLVTFEMFEQVRHERVTHVAVDYTLSHVGPGQYFKSEAAVAKRRRMRLYTMSNTGGLTWDCGVIPYEPAPFQWARRHAALHEARRRWNLSGLMESHHYGWWPSFISELAKGSFWAPSPPAAILARALARRDYGAQAASLVVKAWRDWSEAIRRDYIPTNEDQYGPFRVGPSYPLIFHPNLSRSFAAKDVKIPAAWHASNGNRIVFSLYRPLDDPRQSPGSCRVAVEIRSLRRMAARWRAGIRSLETALPLMPAHKRSAGDQLLNLGRFLYNTMTTVMHVKAWWMLNQQLLVTDKPRTMRKLLNDMERLARREIENAYATIPLVEKDSRLGWEPSMEYMTDAAHLRWKIAQVQTVLRSDIPDYRRALRAGSQ